MKITLLISLMLHFYFAHAQQEQLDSCKLVISDFNRVTLYKFEVDSIAFENTSERRDIMNLWESRNGLQSLGRSLEDNRTFFRFMSFRNVQNIFGEPDTIEGEYYLEPFEKDGIYYGCSVIFRNYQGIIYDVEFVNR